MPVIKITFTEVTSGKQHNYIHPNCSKKDFYAGALQCLRATNSEGVLLLHNMIIPREVLQQCFIYCEEISSASPSSLSPTN